MRTCSKITVTKKVTINKNVHLYSGIILRLLAFVLALAAGQNASFAAESQTTLAILAGCDLQFGSSLRYDNGVDTSVALHSSGLILEFHRSQNTDSIWYRLGKLVPPDVNNVTWGGSHNVGVDGFWPAVALTKEGYVIEVHSDRASKKGSKQFYHVGTIDPYGDENQTISWKTDFIHWDGGFHTSIAINGNGVIVGVHESNTGGTGLYYRVGHLRNPAGGDYTIAWTSGTTGIGYDDGINPHIAINNNNQVVEVHQVTDEDLLHYRRGTLFAGRITFAQSQRYDNDAAQPAVALLDSGLVLEVHSAGDDLNSRTGTLNPSNSTIIEWSTPVEIDTVNGSTYPALATNGNYAIQTHELAFGGGLFFSTAAICQAFR
jgi:hypothetical protein